MRATVGAAVLVLAATAGPKTPAKPAIADPAQSALSLPATTIRIGVLNGETYAVTELPLEAYVARVLGGEAAPDTPPSALEALAIAVRTYTLANLGRHRAASFDLCDQTHCQVMRTATPTTERAAQATAGQALLSNGVPARIYYSASCGGRTEIPSAVWPGAEDPPFLPSREDDACGGRPAWTAELASADLQRSLEAAGFRGRMRNMRIASRNGSGRVAQLELEGVTPGQISGQDLRVVVGRTLGWQRVLSTAFELRRIGDVYRFTGHGWGHGVGLCVIGSMRLAAEGRGAKVILDRYFPGLTVGFFTPRVTVAPAAVSPSPGDRPAVVSPPVASGSEVTVLLREGDEDEREAIVALTARARDDLAKRLGVPSLPRVTLRFHPGTDDYERATRVAWFTSTSRVDDELHFLPLAVLRDRGVLERVIRRALVRLMTDEALGGRPMWVREGAALYYAEVPTLDRDVPRTRCPRDVELLSPVSAGALNDAYTRARACFARQIASDRPWREVR